jgi:cytochrome c-type biogenesis protein CcmH
VSRRSVVRRALAVGLVAGGAVACAPRPALAQEPVGEANSETPDAVQEGGQDAEAGERDAGADRSALTDPMEADLDARAAEVAGELRCPVCRNQSVLESNAELSREMQGVVRERLAAGETPEEVKAYFVSRYGEWILLQPEARGINLLVYGLPGIALVLGFFLARNRLRKWASAGTAGTGPEVEVLSEDDERWLRDALREGQGTRS